MLDQIKKDIVLAMKARDVARVSILRLVVSECDTIAGRNQKVDVPSVIKKLMKSINETLELTTDDHMKVSLNNELTILDSYLPKALTKAEVFASLYSRENLIKEARNDGAAIGVAMQALKGLNVDGNVVKECVLKIRQ